MLLHLCKIGSEKPCSCVSIVGIKNFKSKRSKSMRKKRVFLAVAALTVLVSGSLVYAGGRKYTMTKFHNELGEEVYYPVAEPEEPTAQEIIENKAKKQYAAPETAEIGDVFLGEDGYERVFAVSEDGAFMTEGVSAPEGNDEEEVEGE